VVCATLRHLEDMVHTGEFREDLWFRINTFEIHLPPLRERLEDLPELIQHLAKRYAGSVTASAAGRSTGLRSGRDLFTADAYKIMQRHPWPGNVRQLANVIEHALILSDTVPIGPEALPQPFLRMQPAGFGLRASGFREQVSDENPEARILKPESFSPMKSLRDLEIEAINNALDRHKGNKNKAAEELGISLKTLYNKLSQQESKKSA